MTDGLNAVWSNDRAAHTDTNPKNLELASYVKLCYVDDHKLGREQVGLREWYSTIDHAFVLYLLLNCINQYKKCDYCCFYW